MKTRIKLIGALMATMAAFALSAFAGIVSYDNSVDYAQYVQRDHYLDAEIWTSNDEYYEGDKITISFRTNKDCFVSIYNIDTRGQVNLIYPAEPGDAQHHTIPGKQTHPGHHGYPEPGQDIEQHRPRAVHQHREVEV